MLAILDALGLAYEVDHRLVRGLDYYTRTSFEFYAAGREGQQDALGGGGRYDGLVELLGGPSTPGIGFGIGIDRTVLAMEAAGGEVPAGEQLIAVLGATDDLPARLRLATELRDAGLAVGPTGRCASSAGSSSQPRRPARGGRSSSVIRRTPDAEGHGERRAAGRASPSTTSSGWSERRALSVTPASDAPVAGRGSPRQG